MIKRLSRCCANTIGGRESHSRARPDPPIRRLGAFSHLSGSRRGWYHTDRHPGAALAVKLTAPAAAAALVNALQHEEAAEEGQDDHGSPLTFWPAYRWASGHT